MKRVIVDNDDALLSLTAFESLPDEMVSEILRYVLHDVGNSFEQFKAAVEMRMTSVRLRNLIDFGILGSVSGLSDELYAEVDDNLISFFPGLRSLTCYSIETQTTVRFFDSFTRLELLFVSPEDNLTDMALRRLTTLRTLVFNADRDEERRRKRRDYISNHGIETLTNLTSLGLDSDSWIDDTGILPSAPFLESLSLRGMSVGGSSFASMTRLRELSLGRETRINDDAISLVAPTLESLTVDGSPFIGKSFIGMTQLRELSARNFFFAWSYLPSLAGRLTKLTLDNVDIDDEDDPYAILNLTRLNELTLDGKKTPVTNTVLAQMTWLTALTIIGCDSIKDEGLIPLCHMRNLQVNHRITGNALVNMRNSLEDLMLQEISQIRWSDLVQCASLKVVHVYSFDDLDAPMTQEALEKETGVDFSVYGSFYDDID